MNQAKDNLIENLSNKQVKRIKFLLAKERNCSTSEIQEISMEDLIRLSPAKQAAFNALQYRVSQRIETAKKTVSITAVCATTGINIGIDIPRIPGFFLSYVNPLAEYENCRLLAKRGFAYLSQLDTQVLAGITMILADNYGLFEFPADSTGAMKNSLLRSCGKDELVKAILFIERNVHSVNFKRIPQLSFRSSPDLSQGEFSVRLHNWLGIAVDRLVPVAIARTAVDLEELDEVAPKFSGGYTYIKDVKKAEKLALSEKKKEEKALKKELEVGSQAVRELFKDGILTIQLRNYLIKTFDMDTFTTVDANFKAKLSMKVSMLPLADSRTEKIVELLALKTAAVELEDLFESLASTDLVERSETNSHRNPASIESLSSTTNALSEFIERADNKIEQVCGTACTNENGDLLCIGKNKEGNEQLVPANFWKDMTFSQKLIYKRKNGVVS